MLPDKDKVTVQCNHGMRTKNADQSNIRRIGMSCIGRVMTHEEGTFEKRSIPPQGGIEWRDRNKFSQAGTGIGEMFYGQQ